MRGRDGKIFYGYIVVIASVFIIFLMHGSSSTYGVFFSPLQTEFGWSRTTISGAHSLAFFLEGLFSLAIGGLSDRFGPRLVIIGSGLIMGLGFYLMSQINAVWQLYFFYPAIVGMGVASGNVVLLSTTARWFTKRRGMMIAIVKVGTGAGIFAMPLVATWLISSYGWRNSYIYIAIVGLIGIVIAAQFLRRDPGEKGLQAYGSIESKTTDAHFVDTGFSLQEALRNWQFWLVCITYLSLLYVTVSMTLHIVPRALDAGLTVTQAAGVLSTIGGVSILGRLFMGSISDKISCRRAVLICFIILVTALSWLQFADRLWGLYLYAVIYGFAHGGFFALIAPLIAELFGTRSHGAIYGASIFISHIGGAIGPIATARIFDTTGSYQIAFLIILGAGITGLILSTLLRPISAQAGP
ncbi:MAG: MFS transporter [Dehalococcoidales bacterium]|nr:MFS transporter [Dehalococcoidales bacterium]